MTEPLNTPCGPLSAVARGLDPNGRTVWVACPCGWHLTGLTSNRAALREHHRHRKLAGTVRTNQHARDPR